MRALGRMMGSEMFGIQHRMHELRNATEEVATLT